MFIDPLVWLFIGAFGSWLILGLVYGFNAPKPEPPTQMPMGMTPDEFYQGCREALLAELDKEAKDNL